MTSTADASTIPPSSWLTLAVTSVAGFMVSLEITVIALAFPEIREQFPGASESTLSWIITAYNIGVASLLLVSGWAADRYGRKVLFLAGLSVFALGSLLSGLAPSVELLIGARVLQSIGGAMQFPAGLALLLPAFPFEKRQMAIGIWGAMGGLAAAVGPPIGGLLVGAFGWRSVFLVNVPVAVLAVIAGRSWLTESVGDGADSDERVDLVSIPLASVGVGIVVFAIVQTEVWGVVSWQTVMTVAVGLALVGCFVIRSSTHPAPLFDLDLFRLRSYTLSMLGSVGFLVGFFGFFVPFPTFLQEAWGWSPIEVGLALLWGPALAAVLSPISGRWADRVGSGIVLTVGGLFGMASMATFLLFTGSEPRLFLGVIVPSLLLGVSAGCSFAPSVGAAMQDVRPALFGMAGAGRTTAYQLSIAVAIALAVAVVGRADTVAERVDAAQNGWWLCFGAFALQAVVFGFLFPKGRATAPAPA